MSGVEDVQRTMGVAVRPQASSVGGRVGVVDVEGLTIAVLRPARPDAVRRLGALAARQIRQPHAEERHDP